jgi:hypothetical protein
MRIALLVIAVLAVVLVGCAGGPKGDGGKKAAPMSKQIVRQVVEVNQSGNLPSAEGIRVSCNADFLLHTIAVNSDGGGNMGLVLIGPISAAGVVSDSLTFQVPATGYNVSLGSTAGKGGEAVVIRGKIVNVPPQATKINIHLEVVTEPGATVSIDNEK